MRNVALESRLNKRSHNDIIFFVLFFLNLNVNVLLYFC